MRRFQRSDWLGALAVAVALTLAGCANAYNSGVSVAPAPSVSVSTNSISLNSAKTSDPRETIQKLESLPRNERPQNFTASVRYDKLILTDVKTQGKTDVSIPGNLVHVSFAPYLKKSHECYFHSLTTCTGELFKKRVHVAIADKTDGKVVINKDETTFDNGYIAAWLPKDHEFAVVITYAQDGVKYQSSQTIGTHDGDPTCITTTTKLTRM